MSDIVRAWKDEDYRQSLSVEEQGTLPTNPAGEIDLTDEELDAVYGAWGKRGPQNYTQIAPADNRQWNFSAGNFGFIEDHSCNDPVAIGSGASVGILPSMLSSLGL